MKKILVLAMLMLLIACNSKESANPKTVERFDRSNWALLDGNPDAHKGASVEVVGKVFKTPEKTDKGTFWQMWVDPKNSKYNTLVAFSDPSFAIKDGDFVRITGALRGTFTGENAFGAKVSAPIVDAETATIVDALAVASPARHTASINLPLKQNDLILTVEKVEFAEDETRVFLRINNATKHNASFYSFNAKAQQGAKQFDAESFTDYPKIQSEILPGVQTAGVISFPAMAKEPTKLILEARTDNFYQNFKPYIFDVQP